MEKKRGVYNLITLSVLVLFAFAVGYNSNSLDTSSLQGTALNYKGNVCVYKNGDLIYCDHNLLYDYGKNLTRDLLGIGATAPFLNITLCNASAGCGAPVAANSEPFSAFTNCGLSSAQGTYATIHNAPGNWSVTKTFTSTCDNIVTNSTRLSNVTGGAFAGNTFTAVTLQTNDQLTINWTLMVS